MLPRYTRFCGLVSAVMIALCITGIAGIPWSPVAVEMTNSTADMTNSTADMTNSTADMTKSTDDMTNSTADIVLEPFVPTTQQKEQNKGREKVVTTEATGSINEVGIAGIPWIPVAVEMTNSTADMTNSTADMTNSTADMTNSTDDMTNSTADIVLEPFVPTTQQKEQNKGREKVVTTEATGSINEVGIAGIPWIPVAVEMTNSTADMTNSTADMTNSTADMMNSTDDMTNSTTDIVLEPFVPTAQQKEQNKGREKVVTTEATGSINDVEHRANEKYGKAFSFNMTCYHYNKTECVYKMTMLNVSHEHVPICTPKIIKCSKKQEFCMNMFDLVNRNSSILKQHDGLIYSGCSYSGNGLRPEYNDGECTYTDNPSWTDTVDNTTSSRCYCRGKLCNEWRKPYKELRHPRDSYFAYSDYDTTITTTTAFPPTTPYISSKAETSIMATMSAIIVVVVVGAIVGFIIWRRRWYRTCMSTKSSTTESNDMNDPSISDASGDTISDVVIDRIELHKPSMVLHKQGKFSKVYTLDGLYQDCKAVAKVYGDKKFWDQERQIYSVYGMQNHENIARFLGVALINDDYAILLEFYSSTLNSYLKANTLKWTEMLSVMHSMMKGYSHLHSMYTEDVDAYKLPIAHRDVKSQNIMLDSHLNVKICDFNLSMVLEKTQIDTDALSMPGTSRYMAPELLGGHMLRSREGLLQTDVYSIALVLWEIYSRYENNKAASKSFRPAYDEFVCSNPSVETMYEVVCVKKKRPNLPSSSNATLDEIASTIADSWEEDGDLRLTSAGIESRIEGWMKSHPLSPYSHVNDFDVRTVNNCMSVENNNKANLKRENDKKFNYSEIKPQS